MFPEADYWLRFFGIVTTSTTDTSEQLWQARGRNLNNIRGYEHYMTDYPTFIEEDAQKGFEWE